MDSFDRSAEKPPLTARSHQPDTNHILQTPRLSVRHLAPTDAPAFFELMGNPHVMDPIPQKPLNKEDSDAKLTELIQLEKSSTTRIWGLCEKGSNTMIGICGVLKNDQGEDEIAYRIIESYWGKGYGTEITKGLIGYCFDCLKSDLVTADVCVDNARSVRILNKFMAVEKEFFNPEDNCTDRRYVLTRERWIKQRP